MIRLGGSDSNYISQYGFTLQQCHIKPQVERQVSSYVNEYCDETRQLGPPETDPIAIAVELRYSRTHKYDEQAKMSERINLAIDRIGSDLIRSDKTPGCAQ